MRITFQNFLYLCSREHQLNGLWSKTNSNATTVLKYAEAFQQMIDARKIHLLYSKNTPVFFPQT